MREDNPNAIMHPREWLKRELERFRFAKLQKKGNGAVYIVHVHGNLWYEFESEEE